PEDFRDEARSLGLQEEWFRVADIHTVVEDERVRLLATHHFWRADQQCFTVRLSAIDLTRAELESGTTPGEWHTLFESTPCLPLLLENRPCFSGLEMGGRTAQLDEATVLVTVGDHEFDGVNAPGSFAQDSTVSYGKTFSIDLDTGEARAFTFGHRNPQGLFVDEDGSIWSTEHGPRGGDELNRLSKGLNYGWPIATYGVS